MVIDLHTHITISGFPGFVRAMNKNPFSATTLLKCMDREGVDQSVVLPLANPENEGLLAVADTRETLRACTRHSDRLIPFCNIDPRAMLNTPEADLSRMISAYRDLGCRGIGEICANIPLEDPRFHNLFHHAEQQRMPLLFHITGVEGGVYGVIDGMGLPGLANSLDSFPRAVFIGHAPFFWNAMDGALTREQSLGYPKGPIRKTGALWKLLEKHPNLYGDLSAGSAHNAITRDPETGCRFLVRFYKQLCYGSDRFTYANEPTPPMLVFLREALARKKLTRRQFDRIMYRNVQQILGF